MSLQQVFAFLLLPFPFGLIACATVNERDTKKAEGYYHEGLADLNSDQQKAFVSFQKAVQINPRHKEAHYYLGHVYVLQGKYNLAEHEFRDVIRIDPDYSEAHNYLGNVLAQQRRWTEAIESYRQALSNPLYSTPDIARFHLGLAYAQEALSRAAALDKGGQYALEAGKLLERLKP
jgi:Tfp pilus assembly protein PilF